MWDVAARFSGESNGFKLAVAAAYSEVSSKAATGQVVITRLGPTRRCLRPWRL